LYDGLFIFLYLKIKVEGRRVLIMKIEVHLRNGNSPIIDLGEVPDHLDIDGVEFVDFMLDVCESKGIDVYKITHIRGINFYSK